MTSAVKKQKEIISKSRLSDAWKNGMPLHSEAPEVVIETKSKSDIIHFYITITLLIRSNINEQNVKCNVMWVLR